MHGLREVRTDQLACFGLDLEPDGQERGIGAGAQFEGALLAFVPARQSQCRQAPGQHLAANKLANFGQETWPIDH